MYHIRQATICLLVAMSCNFRLIAIATGQSKNAIRKVCKVLSEKDSSRPQLVFDAVYLLKKTKRRRPDVTHALLDFYDEAKTLSEFSTA